MHKGPAPLGREEDNVQHAAEDVVPTLRREVVRLRGEVLGLELLLHIRPRHGPEEEQVEREHEEDRLLPGSARDAREGARHRPVQLLRLACFLGKGGPPPPVPGDQKVSGAEHGLRPENCLLQALPRLWPPVVCCARSKTISLNVER